MDEQLISWLSTHIAVPDLPDLLVTRAGYTSISDTEVLIMCNNEGLSLLDLSDLWIIGAGYAQFPTGEKPVMFYLRDDF